MSVEWANGYVGVPYLANGRDRSGWDCWGLLVAVFYEQHGIALPDWRPSDDPVIPAREYVTAATEIGQDHATEILLPERWAVAVVRRHKLAHHVGVVVGDGYRVLHCGSFTHGTVCESLPSFLRSYPNTTFWRLKAMHGDAPST
jgi:cell wall-associated NlpC family hydrolase